MPSFQAPVQQTQSNTINTQQAQQSSSFDSEDIKKFKDLVSKGIDPARAKALIQKAKGIKPAEELSTARSIGE